MTVVRDPLGDSNANQLSSGDVVDDTFRLAQSIGSSMSKETIALIVALLNKYPQISADSLRYIVDELEGAIVRRRGRR